MKYFAIRLPEKIFNKLEEKARENGDKTSSYTRSLIEKALELEDYREKNNDGKAEFKYNKESEKKLYEIYLFLKASLSYNDKISSETRDDIFKKVEEKAGKWASRME